MVMNMQRERAHDLLSEIVPLLRQHYEEIARYKDIPLDPDFKAYTVAEESGALRCYTLRNDGELIGYAIFLVKRNAHYKTSLQAIQDVLFVSPSHRKTRAGISLLRFCETELRHEGVQVVYHHMKAQHSFGRLLEREGYELVDLVYGKRLDGSG